MRQLPQEVGESVFCVPYVSRPEFNRSAPPVPQAPMLWLNLAAVFPPQLPPTLKFPSRPSPQRARGERQNPSHKRSRARRAAAATPMTRQRRTHQRYAGGANAAAWALIPRSRPRRSGRTQWNSPANPPVYRPPHRAAIPDYTSQTSEGSFDITVNSGPCTQGESWHAAASSASTSPQIFVFRIS
jgi:hypothetical protein